ncbi:NACHT domain-containing protein [Actinoplanes rectilineatus]|uniref:NACHT domain-containing protein n=1 Tax=Actinoplanes rectilineatus TaxID=113571 RepID=UPI0005F2CE3D|nr:NACHT domain-containing protein [Actinoplanes rectilineatus]
MRRPSPIAATALSVVLALLTNLATGTIEVAGPWGVTGVWVLTALCGLAALVVEVRHRRQWGVPHWGDDRDSTLDQLAQAVDLQWRTAERQRRINDPVALPVRWVTAPATVMDHWANIGLAPAGQDAGPLDLDGDLDRLADVYQRIPSGRLVLLGPVGSGKSVLAARLALQLLERREPGGAVPVVLSVASWTPVNDGHTDGQSLPEWIAGRLVRDHPGLAGAAGDGRSTARMLIDDGHLLPILDGLDEMPAGLHAWALRGIGEAGLPVVLTSRPHEYAEAVSATAPLARAAVVEVQPLSGDDLLVYLPRSASPARGDDWTSMLHGLDEDAPVRRALANPLMAHLARVVYAESGHRPPSELLAFSRVAEVERHLLGAYLPAVYPHRSRRAVQGWLSTLARYAQHRRSPDLEWWRLSQAVSLPVAVLLYFLLIGGLTGTFLLLGHAGHLDQIPVRGYAVDAVLRYGLAGILPVGYALFTARSGAVGRTRFLVVCVLWAFAGAVAGTLATRLRWYLEYGPEVFLGQQGIQTTVIGAVASAALLGPIAGLALGIAGPRPRPSATRLGVHSRPERLLRSVLTGGALGCAATLFYWLATEAVFRAAGTSGILAVGMDAMLFDLVDRPLLLLGLGAALGMVCGLAVGSRVPLDVCEEVGPLRSLSLARTSALLQMLLIGMVASAAIGIATAFADPSASPWQGLTSGMLLALLFGLCATVWGQWLILVRVWLPLTGRLPWRPTRFLADAYERGVLRQSGTAWQFRHARLQEHLAVTPTADDTGAEAERRRAASRR